MLPFISREGDKQMERSFLMIAFLIAVAAEFDYPFVVSFRRQQQQQGAKLLHCASKADLSCCCFDPLNSVPVQSIPVHLVLSALWPFHHNCKLNIVVGFGLY